MNILEKVEIVYENKDIIAVNKPAGLIVHEDGKRQEPSLVHWVLEHYPQIKGVGEPLKLSSGEIIERAGIVHRIDKETSGVVLIAKSQKSYEFLKDLFKSRKVEKTYNTFVYGKVKQSSGEIDLPIGRSKKNFKKRDVGDFLRGQSREALTEYKVIDYKEKASFLEVSPKTGRTHQIRVHLNAIGHPVVADKLYAPNRETILGFQRLALHARSVSFSLPSGVKILIEVPLPEDFESAKIQLGGLPN